MAAVTSNHEEESSGKENHDSDRESCKRISFANTPTVTVYGVGPYSGLEPLRGSRAYAKKRKELRMGQKSLKLKLVSERNKIKEEIREQNLSESAAVVSSDQEKDITEEPSTKAKHATKTSLSKKILKVPKVNVNEIDLDSKLELLIRQRYCKERLVEQNMVSKKRKVNKASKEQEKHLKMNMLLQQIRNGSERKKINHKRRETVEERQQKMVYSWLTKCRIPSPSPSKVAKLGFWSDPTPTRDPTRIVSKQSNRIVSKKSTRIVSKRSN